MIAALATLAIVSSVHVGSTKLQPGYLIRGGKVYDGLGGPARKVDIRVHGDTIVEVGTRLPVQGEKEIDARKLAVAPGFIDAHSHADGGIFEDPKAETQVRQGITTSVVGEDGGSTYPLEDFFNHLSRRPCALNFASFVGHGTVRGRVLGMAERAPTADERKQMEAIIDHEMSSGALGLSTGLEYEPNRYATTDEVIDLAKVAGRKGGIYISHVRNEDNSAFEAFAELVRVAKEGHLAAEINHIKLGSSSVWGKAKDVISMMVDAEKAGADVTADVYPYLYWQSTIRVIIPTEHFEDQSLWKKGLSDIGGAGHVLLTAYSPNPKWAGKTLAQLSQYSGKDPVTLCQEIVQNCYGNGKKGSENVVVTAMDEPDLETFIACPRIMFCSDGGLNGTHPRGAGSFPRILGRYVRDRHVISLSEAIRKMTSLPAARFGFTDRGVLARGKKADIVLFDPSKVCDTATTAQPTSPPLGIPTVFVNGSPVLQVGRPTGNFPGQVIKHTAKPQGVLLRSPVQTISSSKATDLARPSKSGNRVAWVMFIR